MSKTLVCAIQIGTSRICAAAAWRDQNGNYEIVALDQEPSEGCVRRGCIVNIEQTAAHIKSLVGKLSNRVKSDECLGIEAAYVGLDGISMHSQMHHPSIELEDGVSVNSDSVAALRQKSLQYYLPGYDILGIEPTGYTLDDIDCLNPIGRTGGQLIAHHQLVTAHQRLRLNVRAAMKLAGVRLVDVLATPLCSAKILTPDEKQRGCVLVDIGYSLTTMSVYADGALQYLAAIPLGSNAVTQDIAVARNISLEEAEKEKIEQNELDIVSRCRFEEIAANINNQIELSGCRNRIAAGCVLTGGASLQRGLTTLFGERLGISRIEARAYSEITFGISARKPQLTALTTMIPFCTADCAIEPVVEPKESLFDEQDFESEASIVADTSTVSEEEKTEEITEKIEEKGHEMPAARTKSTGFTRFFKDLISGIDD